MIDSNHMEDDVIRVKCSDACPRNNRPHDCHLCIPCLAYNGKHKPFLYQSNVGRHCKTRVHKECLKKARSPPTRKATEDDCSSSTITDTSRDGSIARCFDRSNPRDDYFQFEYHRKKKGLLHLVARCNFPKEFDWERDRLDNDEAKLDFYTAYTLNGLTRGKREAAMVMNSGWYEVGRRHERQSILNEQPGYRQIRPARTVSEQDTRYFSGVHSIRSNIPCPDVHEFDEHHSYVNVRDCLRDAMSRGAVMDLMTLDDILSEWDPTAPITSLTQTKRAKDKALRSVLLALGMREQDVDKKALRTELQRQLRKRGLNWEDVRVCQFLTWTDGIEPNAIKQGRNSVWAGSVTFVPKRQNWNSKFNTYPIVIGREKTKGGKHIDHMAPMDKINRGVDELMRTPMEEQMYYSTREERALCVLVSPYAYFADQPERRKVTSTAAGNQRYHGRFRCSAQHKALDAVVPACANCADMLRQGENPGDCDECCCWDVLGCGPNSKKLLDIKPENAYPKKHTENYLTPEGLMAPKEVTFDGLTKAMNHAWEMMISKKWTAHQTQVFLESECLDGGIVADLRAKGQNRKTLDAILEHIKKCESEDQEPNLTDEQATVLEDSRNNPSSYEIPKTPSHWVSGDTMRKFVDSPMHLLFLGIVKKVLITIKEWMSEQGLFTDFKSRVKEYNKKLEELCLDWLNLQDFREGKFGGWVSENYLAFSRITKWFFQEIGDLVRRDDLDHVVVPDGKPNTRWTKNHCLRWLRDRGITEVSHINRDDLKKMIADYMALPEDEQPPLVNLKRYETSQVEIVLTSLDAMLDALMVPVIIPGETAALAMIRIKDFLTQFHKLDEQLAKKRKQVPQQQGNKKKQQRVKTVYSCPNFLTLLNLPSMMEEFGPLRLLWEGNVHGEAFVKQIKPFLKSGLRDNFASNALRHCMVENSFRLTLDAFDEAFDESTRNVSCKEERPMSLEEAVRDNRRSVTKYRSIEDAQMTMGRRGPLSVIVVYDTQQAWLYACVNTRRGEAPCFHLVRCLTSDGFPKFGCCYRVWQLESRPVPTTPNFDECSVSFGVLLPVQENNGPAAHTLVCKSRYQFLAS